MPFHLACPRCKETLVVPSKKAGSYAMCPSCKGRLWVPEKPPSDSAVPLASDGERLAVPADPNGSGGSLSVARTNSSPAWSPPLASTSGPVVAPPPTPPAPPRGVAPPAPLVPPVKTARLITAAAVVSTIQPTADGKLSELQLDDATRTLEGRPKGKSLSPLILLVVLSLSVALSMVAAMVDFSAPDASRSRRRIEARQRIEANYFPLVAEHGKATPPERYQRYLAEAARAYTRGDRPLERRMYNRVLDLLRAERDHAQRGLTGSRERDKQLEELITIVLSDD